MRINTKHEIFYEFLENITTNINSSIDVSKYFSLTEEKKKSLQYVFIKLLKNIIKVKGQFTNEEIKDLLEHLMSYNIKIENYELTSLLDDIHNHYENFITETNVKNNSRTKKDAKLN